MIGRRGTTCHHIALESLSKNSSLLCQHTCTHIVCLLSAAHANSLILVLMMCREQKHLALLSVCSKELVRLIYQWKQNILCLNEKQLGLYGHHVRPCLRQTHTHSYKVELTCRACQSSVQQSPLCPARTFSGTSWFPSL